MEQSLLELAAVIAEGKEPEYILQVYRKALDCMPFSVGIIGLDEKIIFVNARMLRKLHITEKELIGEHCSVTKSPFCGTDKCCNSRLEQGLKGVPLRWGNHFYAANAQYLYNLDGERIFLYSFRAQGTP